MRLDIDPGSGFCAGVIRAITRAEQCLKEPGSVLYSLGAIVHNDAELSRLEAEGMVTLTLDDLSRSQDGKGANLLIRAHGEPPTTYTLAKTKNFNIIDCTCPVVLKLQQRISQAYASMGEKDRVVIFGKVGHAEVLGLVGQTAGRALVIENLSALEGALASGELNLDGRIEIFSQTTKSPSEYKIVCETLKKSMEEHGGGELVVHDTICSQVASRHSKLGEFASSHDIVVFVAGRESSNGKVLFQLCKDHNPRSYHIESSSDIDPMWFKPSDSVGVCGATSTPKWLLQDVGQKILKIAD